MQSPREILTDLWALAGGDPSALEAVMLTGEEPQLPSSFRVATAAQASIAATGLAAAQVWKLRSGQSQDVAVDMRHAIVECRSERYLRVDGKPPPPAWDVIAGIYRTRDQRFVRLHTNFRHHRDAVCRVLNCKPERDDVQAALMQWDGEAFKTVARRRPPACRTARARSVAGDRRSRRRPHARSAWRRCAADFRSRSAGEPLAHHRHRPRQADELCRTQERTGAGQLARPAGGCGYFLARLSSASARSARLLAAGRRPDQPRHRLF